MPNGGLAGAVEAELANVDPAGVTSDVEVQGRTYIGSWVYGCTLNFFCQEPSI